MKLCRKCGETKPVTEFYRRRYRRGGSLGWDNYCKTCRKIVGHIWYLKNKEKCFEKTKRWQKNNRDKCIITTRNWQNANRARATQIEVRRQAKKVKATPKWANQELIDTIYSISDLYRKAGIDCVVDHIVPIKSKYVCGLHVPANLQLIYRIDNIVKGNRWWPDMPNG